MRTQLPLRKRFLSSGRAIACALPLLAAALPTLARDTNAQAMIGQFEEGKKVVGVSILNSQKQAMGRIEDAVVDLESGRILYTIAAINGLADKVALPSESFTVQGQGNAARIHILNVERAKLDTAPKFTADKENQLGDTAFVSEVYKFFGTPMWWEGSNHAQGQQPTGTFNNVHKVSALANKSVKDLANADLGKIDDVVLDLHAARVPYVLLTKQAGMAYAIPPNAFTLSADKQTLTSGINLQTLNSAPRFARNNLQMLANRATATAIYRHYGKQPYFSEGLSPTGRDTNSYIYPGK